MRKRRDKIPAGKVERGERKRTVDVIDLDVMARKPNAEMPLAVLHSDVKDVQDAIVRPETVVRWHRMGFAAYWRWKSRPRIRCGIR